MNNNEFYLALRSNQSFHTIINKKQIGEYTYLAAVGYAGGGVYEEFYAKLIYNEQGEITGQFSRSIGSCEWETKLTSLKFNKENQWFDAEIEELYELMESEDEKIQYKIIDELKKFIYYGYDEEEDLEYEYPEAKPVDTSFFIEIEGSEGHYCNTDWNDEWLEISNSDIWGLSIRFTHLIANY